MCPESMSTTDGDCWDAATFEGATRLRREQALRMSVHERMQWLEEMTRLAEHQATLRGDSSPALRRLRRSPEVGR
jgi:hypothetical protein